MRLTFILGMVLIATWFALSLTKCQRSVTLPLDSFSEGLMSSSEGQSASTDYELTYTAYWGWNMHERVGFSRPDSWWPDASTGWLWIFDKPYDSGGALYRSKDRKRYYFGTFSTGYIFEPDRGTLKRCCYPHLPYTPLGRAITTAKDYRVQRKLDPIADQLPQWLMIDNLAPQSNEPPASRYYLDLEYLGRFGVTTWGRGGRGTGVGFVSYNQSVEPRPSLGEQVP